MSAQDKAINAEVQQLIKFAVGEETYGLDLLRVKEVIRAREVTWLPQAPSCVKGIVNLRGDVIPIIDLRERFGLNQEKGTSATRVIVVEMDGKKAGLVVDSASQVVRIHCDQFSDAPSMIGESARNFITSVGKLGDDLVIMLDAEKLLDSRAMAQ